MTSGANGNAAAIVSYIIEVLHLPLWIHLEQIPFVVGGTRD